MDRRGSTTSRAASSTIDGVTTTDRAAGRALEPHAVARRCCGTGNGSASRATSSRERCSRANLASRCSPHGATIRHRPGVSITPYMLAAGEEKVVADRLRAVLSNPPRKDAAPTPAAPAADLTGQWDVRIDVRGEHVHPHALPPAARQRPRRLASRRLRDARCHRHHRRRHACASAAPMARSTAMR